jgi:rhodanese-related sulfurtransferase
MPIHQITPPEAKRILDENSNSIYVDVRSVREFEQGHPAGAINIPLLDYNEERGGMFPNPDFAKVSEAVLSKDKKLIVGCQAGGRSQKACMILEQLGYQDLSNVLGGFGGGMSPTGQPVLGWRDSGLPVSEESGEGIGYESLVKKIIG